MGPVNRPRSPVLGPVVESAPSISGTPMLSDHEQNSPGTPRASSSEPLASKQNSSLLSRKGAQSPSHLGPLSVATAPATGLPTSSGLGKTQTVFIHKLYDMLEDQSLSHLIWWSPSNDSFCLYPGEEFSNVLAQYFKHTNIASFIRQLNMYGFHKVNDSFQSDEKPLASAAPASQPGSMSTRWEFRHSANQFRKGDVHSLSLIKRKLSKLMNSHKEIVSLKTLPPTSSASMDEKPTTYPEQAQQLYHRAVYQQLWDQMSDSGSTQLGSPKVTTPQTLYAPPAVVAYHSYPIYPHQVTASTVPHSPGSPPYPEHGVSSPSYIHQSQLQPQLRQPSVQTPALPVDQSINLKLIEMNNAITTLKSCYLDLVTRYDNLSALYQRSQSELLQLTEIVERTMVRSHESDIKKESDVVDRSKTRTPVNRITTPSQDSGMSPMSGKPPHSKNPDLDSFKHQLLSKMTQPVPVPPQSQKTNQHNYHLNDVSLTLSKNSATHNIVPQHYPLNPNYSLYNNSDAAFRHFKMSNEEIYQQKTATSSNRHLSVLMDPLQPIPSRTPVSNRPMMGPESKEQPASESTTPTYVQQYQPLTMHQPPVHALHQYIRQEVPLQQRTLSLPIIDKAIRSDNATQQRHSTTTLSHGQGRTLHELETGRHGLVVRALSSFASQTQSSPHHPIPHVHPGQQSPSGQPVQQVQSANPIPVLQVAGQPLHIQTHAAQRQAETGSPHQVSTPPRDLKLPLRNQLPSVSELDKSIKSSGTSGRVFDILLDSGDDRNKKRRVET